MKITVDRKTFADALSEVAPFAPTKAPIAILKYARVTTKDTRMKIEANDTQNAMVKYIKTEESDEDGTFLIDIAELNRFIQKVKGNTIEIDVDGTTVRVKHSKGSAEFATENADEFPTFRMPQDEAKELTILAEILSDAVQKGRNFVATEQIRPQLCAIYAYTEGNDFGYCATNTHKLINGVMPHNDPFPADLHFFIMPPVFPAIINACKGAETAKVHITDSHVQYTIGNTRIQTVQSKGNFPSFKRVIPQTWNMECAVDKSELMEALGRASLFCDVNECVKVDVTRMDMTISADNLDFGKSSCENVTHNGCDGEIKIGVNVSYMQDCASVLQNGDVLLRMTDPSRPILFMQRENPNLKVITMPLTLLNEQ